MSRRPEQTFLGLAVVIALMATSAMAQCGQEEASKAKCGSKSKHDGHGLFMGSGLSFSVPASSPKVYIPAPAKPSTLTMGGTVYQVDGGGGIVYDPVVPAPPPQPTKIAVVVLGNCDYSGQIDKLPLWCQPFAYILGSDKDFTAVDRETWEEMQADFRNRGYEVHAYDFSTDQGLRAGRTAFLSDLQDPRMKAFGFCGHGSAQDGVAQLVLGNGSKGNGVTALTPDGASGLRGQNATEVVIIHACYQGATENGAAWKAAFHVSDENFHSHAESTKPHPNNEWQKAWE